MCRKKTALHFMKSRAQKKIPIVIFRISCLFLSGLNVSAQTGNTAFVKNRLSAYNISWNTPGPTSAQSMPLGNGDIGLNVWVAPNGDLEFYIGKTDAWGENNYGDKGLLKLGKIKIGLLPGSFNKQVSFKQSLLLHEGEVMIQEGSGTDRKQIRIWVDALNPAIHVELNSKKPFYTTLELDDWRKSNDGDVSKDSVIADLNNKIVWYHQNQTGSDSHVEGNIFGAGIIGNSMASINSSTLKSKKAATIQQISIYPLTLQHTSVKHWRSQLDQQINKGESQNLFAARNNHRQWWSRFWKRSWIFIDGDTTGGMVNQGYILQRFITACAGRGAYPIKFNGSIFNVDDPKYKLLDHAPVAVNADYRTWGGQYWFQNTRAMYWPRLMAGDFDIMLPLFNMYRNMLDDNKSQIQRYYHHDGAYFAETAPFWGGLKYMGPEVPRDWTGHYFTPILELSMMMLDYYQYTADKAFLNSTLLPIAKSGITFFDEHFKRDESGKILLDSVNAVETFWKVHNPAPDIAGLHAVLARLNELPAGLVDAATRNDWKRIENELPDLPTGVKNDARVLLPYTGDQIEKSRNTENPELYAIYPFRLFGLGKPDLDLALASFAARNFTQKGCWMPDAIQAAMLGLTNEAKDYVTYSFRLKDPDLKFPAFWAPTNDYQPDQDNGGNGENGLQQMLMQCEGKRIILLPAWPKEWSVSFKLNAPDRTTVEGKVIDGKITRLKVWPAYRAKDVIIAPVFIK
jgi:alpha-L-fucosidase 2